MNPEESDDDFWADDMSLDDEEEEESENGGGDEGEDKGEGEITEEKNSVTFPFETEEGTCSNLKEELIVDDETKRKRCKSEDDDIEEEQEGPDRKRCMTSLTEQRQVYRRNNDSSMTTDYTIPTCTTSQDMYHIDLPHCGSGGCSLRNTVTTDTYKQHLRTVHPDEMSIPLQMNLKGPDTERRAPEGSKTRSLNVFNVSENSKVKVVQQQHDEKIDSVLKKITDQSKLRLERDLNMKLLVKTDKISECEKHVKTWGMVTLTGGPGEGKTMAALYLLKQMSDTDSRRPLILTDPSQWDHIPSSRRQKSKFTVLIDDAFGKTNLVEDLRARWEQKLSMMLPLIEMGTVCLILTFRTNIYNLCVEYFQTNELFKKSPVTDFVSTDISESDRLYLLDNHLKVYGKNLKMSKQDKMKIIQSSELMAFPHSCFLFMSNGKFHRNCPDFFINPLFHLSDAVKMISKRNPVAYLVLLMVMFYDNKLPVRVFSIFDRSSQDKEVTEMLMQVCKMHNAAMLETIKETADSLCKTYLIWNESQELFSFSHRSIYDSIFISFCNAHLRKGVEMCSERTLLEYVRTQKVHGMDSIVFVSEQDFQMFADRLTRELFSGFSSSVVAHPAFKDSNFTRFLFSTWTEERKVEILSLKTETQHAHACIFLTEKTQSYLLKRSMNQNCEPGTFEPYTFQAFEYDSVIASFVMVEADILVMHLMLYANRMKTEHLYNQMLESLLVCSFYRNKSDLVQELLAIGAEISPSCFKAVCVSPNTDDTLADLAFGVLEECDIKEVQLLLTVCLENNKIDVAHRLIQSINMKGGSSALNEVCLQILLLSHNETPSWIVTSLRDGNLVVKLLEKIHDLGGACSSDECVLLAAGCSDVSVIKRVIKYGGNVMCKSPSKKTPLHMAAQFGSFDVLQWLLLQKADTLSVDVNGWTPLHCAVQAFTESSEKVYILLETTCKIIGGDTALLLAVEKGDLGSIYYVCREMQKRQLELGYPLHAAIKQLIHVFSVTYSDTQLQKNTIQHRFEVVNHLRKIGLSLFDEDSTNKTPLHLVVESGNIEILSCLSEAIPISVLVDLLHQSIKCGFPIMFKSILETFKNTIDSDSVSRIHSVTEYICMTNSERVFTQAFSQILQQESAFALNKDTEDSLLHTISKYGHLDLCSEVLKKNAKVNAANFIGITPLHTAASYGHCEMVGFLIEKGANVNVKSHTGDTPLHCAAAHGHVEVVRGLLESKAEINVVNDTGETPVMCAIKHDHKAVVCNLIVKLARVHESSVEVSLPFAGKDLPKIVQTIAKIGNDLTKERPEKVLLLQIGLRHCPDKIINCLFKRDDDKQEMDKCLTQGNDDMIITVLYSYTPLHDAARHGCIQMIKRLVERGADVNTTDLTNNTPLHNAVRPGHTEVIRYLIERGADLDTASKNSTSPLYSTAERCHPETDKYLVKKDAGVEMMSSMNLFHIAVECGSTKKVKYLVEKGADVNMKSCGYSPLHIAVKHGHIEIIKYLVEKNADVNMKSCGYSPLYIAVKHGHIEIVKYLVEKGADVIMKSRGYSPLHSAVEHGHIEIVKYLVEKGADVNMKSDLECSTLHSAVQHGHIEIVKCLVEKGADVNMKSRGYSPLHSAVEHGHIEIVKYLVEKGTDVIMKSPGYSPLHSAVQHGHIEIVKYLVEKGADANMKPDLECSTLHSAVQHGHIEIVKYLVEKGADVIMKSPGYSPLHSAVEHGHIEIVKYLVEKGADVIMKSPGYSPLHSAVQHGHIEIVKYLVEKGADVNMKSDLECSTLHSAVQHGHIEIVKCLVEKGADVNMKSRGYSPLHSAVEHGHIEIVKYLVENGADVIMKSPGYSPLHSAVQHGHIEIVKYLVEKGADANMKPDLECSTLHSAVQHGHIEIVKCLVEKGADVNMKSPGYSPLHSAVEHGHIEIVKYLVEKGADVIMKSPGYSPLHSAVEHGHIEIVKYLVENGADVNMKSRGYSPLHSAVEYCHIKIVKYLVEKGADANMKPDLECSTLHSAVQHGHIEIVKYLVEKGLDVIMKSRGNSPLHSAVEHGHIEIVKYLVEKGVDVNMKPHLGCHTLHSAVQHGHVEIVKYLVENGADVIMKSPAYSPLHSAVEYGHIEIVKYLVEKGADVNMKSRGYSLLDSAVKHSRIEIFKYLVEKVADVNMSSGYSPLHCAVKHGRIEIFKFLVEKGADVNMMSPGYSPLYSAVEHGHIEIVKCLVEKGADVNMKSPGYSPLHSAVEHGHIEIVKFLVEKGADLNMMSYGYSPLHSAVQHGHIEIVKYLVEKGADVIMKSPGYSPLHSAVEHGHIEIVKYLVEKSADVNMKSIKGYSPLYSAVQHGHIEIVKYLVENGADVNMMSYGYSPLGSAVQHGRIEIVKYLVENGADVNMMSSGYSPLHSAVKHGHIEIVKYLVENGAEVNMKSRCYSPLHSAVQHGHTEIVMYLVEKGAEMICSHMEIVFKMKFINSILK